MESIYHVTVDKVDPETNEVVETYLDDTYKGLTIIAEDTDGKMAEVIIHENILGIACKLAAGEKVSQAVRLANTLMDVKKMETESKEKALMRQIMGE